MAAVTSSSPNPFGYKLQKYALRYGFNKYRCSEDPITGQMMITVDANGKTYGFSMDSTVAMSVAGDHVLEAQLKQLSEQLFPTASLTIDPLTGQVMPAGRMRAGANDHLDFREHALENMDDFMTLLQRERENGHRIDYVILRPDQAQTLYKIVDPSMMAAVNADPNAPVMIYGVKIQVQP